MSFRTVHLSVSVEGVPTVVVPVQLRPLRGAARWHFRHMTRAHCTPVTLRDQHGERQYAHPMSCDWAHAQHASMAALDPDGVMLPLAIASDATDLSPEQSAEPVYIVNNALPLHERALSWFELSYASTCPPGLRPSPHIHKPVAALTGAWGRRRASRAGNKRGFWYVVAYFAKLPRRALAGISQAKALALRKALLAEALQALFDEYRAEGADNPALIGERFRDAHGVEQRVYVRFQNFIFDYPVVAAWTLTLQNKVRSAHPKPTEPEEGTTYTSTFIQHASPALGETSCGLATAGR